MGSIRLYNLGEYFRILEKQLPSTGRKKEARPDDSFAEVTLKWKGRDISESVGVDGESVERHELNSNCRKQKYRRYGF